MKEYAEALYNTPARRFLRFQSFVAPKVVPVLFWFMILAQVVSAIFLLWTATDHQYTYDGGVLGETTTTSTPKVIAGLFELTVGPLLTRVVCESIMVLFRTFDACEAILVTARETRNLAGTPR
jgi:Domain of unknown function (DUF4282)